MRLDKYLSDATAAHRSDVKKFIKAGRVTVNNMVVKDGAYSLAAGDAVTLDGREITKKQGFSYYMINKPAGCVTACSDDRDKTVMDYFDDSLRRKLAPVGRLDKDTEGLLLVTDDGELGHFLLSPKRHVDKRYYVRVDKELKESHVSDFAKGFEFKEFTSAPALLTILSEHEAEVVIHEGKFHQVKRMFLAVGLNVLYLRRVSFGNLELDESLKEGEYRELTAEEIQGLFECCKRKEGYEGDKA